MAPTTQAEIFTICNQPSIKYNPLKACAMCKKLIHKRCTRPITGNTSILCSKCIAEKQKGEKEMRNSSSKNTSHRYSSSSTASVSVSASGIHKTPAYMGKNPSKLDSDVISSKKKNTKCECFEDLRIIFNEWEKAIHEQQRLLYDKIETMVKNAISTLNQNITPLTDAVTETNKYRSSTIAATSLNNQSTSVIHSNTSTNNNFTSKSQFVIETNNRCNNNNNNNTNNNNNNNVENFNSNTNLNNNTGKYTYTNLNSHNKNAFLNEKNCCKQTKLHVQGNFNNHYNNNNNYNFLADSDNNSSIIIDTDNIYNGNNNNIYNNNKNSNSYDNFKHFNGELSCSTGNRRNSLRVEDFELHIVGFMPLTATDELRTLSFAILRSISPDFDISEIESIRFLNTRSPEVTLNSVGTQRGANGSTLPSFIIRLTSSNRVSQIMSQKQKLNYFNTNDLDKSMFSQDFVSCIPYTKILVNEVLSRNEYKRFKSLKSIGKNLGFKNIWHRGGKFLARWRSWSQEHFFDCLSDLNTIRDIYCRENYHLQCLTPTCNNTHNDKSEIPKSNY